MWTTTLKCYAFACSAMVLLALPASGADRFSIISKMKRTVIPEMSFKEASFSEVVAFLKQSSRAFDPTSAKTGVNIILKMKAGEKTHVSFDAADITLYDALRAVTLIAEYEWRFVGSILFIEPEPEEKSD
jgi:hypothetical protein